VGRGFESILKGVPDVIEGKPKGQRLQEITFAGEKEEKRKINIRKRRGKMEEVGRNVSSAVVPSLTLFLSGGKKYLESERAKRNRLA